MRTYTLVLEDKRAGERRKIRFRGRDTHEAFILLEHEKTPVEASLWEEGVRLGTIRRNEDDLWELA